MNAIAKSAAPVDRAPTAAWRTLIWLCCWFAAMPAWSADVNYPPVVAGRPLEFPRDEGAHPTFRTEWWYVTGWLTSDSGDALGFQITFFRVRPGVQEDNPSRFAAKQLLLAHVAVSDPKRGSLLSGEKSARQGFGLAQASESALDVRIDDWFMRREGERYHTAAATAKLAVELEFEQTQAPLLQGENGFSRKSPAAGSASYYYSLPQLRTRGRIVIDGRRHSVQGVAWFDHEWSSSYMDGDTRGWDWIGLNLDDGGALMAFRMRDRHGGKVWAAATTRAAGSAVAKTYSPAEVQWSPLRYWRSPRTGVRYPIEWKVTVGERTLMLRPLMEDQESDTRGSTGTIYWEGAVRAFDEANKLVGRGYLELTGYGSRIGF